MLKAKNQNNEAESVLKSIERTDDQKQFSRAQIILSIILLEQNKYIEARKILENIKKDDGDYIFSVARFLAGNILFYQGMYSDAIIAFQDSKKYFYYESECVVSILKNKNHKFIKLLMCLKNFVSIILNTLKLDSKYEEFICHYTRPSTAFLLLGDNELPSNLRLSTIKNVNDPTEGKVLFNYLGLPSRDIGLASFISCFTFNHDSLNQFRLYGKENNQEVSGVSVVLKKNFCDEHLGISNFIEYGVNVDLQIEFSSLENSSANNKKIKKLPVYRCIYIDDESDYIKLAKRNEVDFYREEKPKDFNSYLIDINKKTLEVKSNLKIIKKILNNIMNNKKYNKDVYDILNYILLPLKFLVKHAAFEDEQECRISFITDLSDERIISNVNEKSMYLEYEPLVREYVDKIYLSIGAFQYEDFFIRTLGSSSKVYRSKNPFRNK